jgi:hypothetical protein
MPFSVKGYYANRPLMVTKETASGAFAKAVEWHVVERFADVTISDAKKAIRLTNFHWHGRGRCQAEGGAEEMTRPWTQADLVRLKTMVRQKASSADIARCLGRRVGSVKAKVREVGLVPLKKSQATISER